MARGAKLVGVDIDLSIDQSTVVRSHLRQDGVLVIDSIERAPTSSAICQTCTGIVAKKAMLAPLRACCRVAKTVPCDVCRCRCRPRGKAKRLAR